MTLTEYLKQTETTMWQFSEITKIKIDTLNKYKYGNRIPNREINKKGANKKRCNDLQRLLYSM